MIIKLYRHTIRQREHLPDGTYIDIYDQTDWSSIRNRIPGRDKTVVKIEEKEIEVEDE